MTMKKSKPLSQDAKLLTAGAGLLTLLAAIIVISFTFLVNRVLPAITPDGETSNGEAVHFNLEGFEELGL